jgi:RNA polymerase sigma factor (sigma-70 family)
MYEENQTDEVRRLAGEIYETRYAYLLRIARRNAASRSDAEEAVHDAFVFFISDYDPKLGAPPLAWLTLVLKRRCWRLRDNARLDRRVVADTGADHQEPTETIEALSSGTRALADRVAERDQARRRIRRLKPDQRTAIGMVAAGCTYGEVARTRGWSRTKINRCLVEGRQALHEGVAR